MGDKVFSELKHSVAVDFSVLEETHDWIAVSKPAPLIVHPTDKKGQETLLGGLEALLCYEIVNGARLSIITRLDRETSGVVLIAKNKGTARAMNRAMERREVAKTYLAILAGNPRWKEMEISEPIANQRDVTASKIWLKQLVHSSGRPSHTHFKLIKSFRDCCLVRVSPKTGRMHQIRVHAAHLGHPILGDKIYGDNEDYYLRHIESGLTTDLLRQLKLPRHALHAESIRLQSLDEGIDVCCPLADDLRLFLDRQEVMGA